MRLIDADALTTEIARLVVGGKHAIEEAGHGNFWINGLYDVKKIIDNSPTVEITDYDTGYQDGLEDGLNDIRPQGEWLDEKYVAFHLTCNRCGCNIRRQKNEVFDGDYDYNFCPNCGADMRGDKELYQ